MAAVVTSALRPMLHSSFWLEAYTIPAMLQPFHGASASKGELVLTWGFAILCTLVPLAFYHAGAQPSSLWQSITFYIANLYIAASAIVHTTEGTDAFWGEKEPKLRRIYGARQSRGACRPVSPARGSPHAPAPLPFHPQSSATALPLCCSSLRSPIRRPCAPSRLSSRRRRPLRPALARANWSSPSQRLAPRLRSRWRSRPVLPQPPHPRVCSTFCS